MREVAGSNPGAAGIHMFRYLARLFENLMNGDKITSESGTDVSLSIRLQQFAYSKELEIKMCNLEMGETVAFLNSNFIWRMRKRERGD